MVVIIQYASEEVVIGNGNRSPVNSGR